MQINFTLDTNQPGDIIALRKLTDALTKELHTVPISVEFSKPDELKEEVVTELRENIFTKKLRESAETEKPAKKAKPQTDTPPPPPAVTEPAPKPEKAERVTIEQVRMVIQTKNIDDCKKVLAGMGVKALAEAPAELLPEILTAINELPSM